MDYAEFSNISDALEIENIEKIIILHVHQNEKFSFLKSILKGPTKFSL